MKVEKGFCNICHYHNEEVIVVWKLLFWKFKICQSCISKIFRKFKKDK